MMAPRPAHASTKREPPVSPPTGAPGVDLRWLLLPHAVAIAAFGGAFAVMMIAGTNRLTADLAFAVAGCVATGLATLSSLVAIAAFARGRGRKRRGWVLIGHLGLLALAVWLGFEWLGHHLV